MGWNSVNWQNERDSDHIDYDRLGNYLRAFGTVVLQKEIEDESFGEKGSLVGEGNRISSLVAESKVYHYEDSTVLLKLFKPQRTEIEVYSPNRNRAQQLLEEILTKSKLSLSPIGSN